MLSHCVLSKNLLINITYLFIYYFRVLIYLLNLFTLPILVVIGIIIVLMCLINCIYYGSLFLLLSFLCVTGGLKNNFHF